MTVEEIKDRIESLRKEADSLEDKLQEEIQQSLKEKYLGKIVNVDNEVYVKVSKVNVDGFFGRYISEFEDAYGDWFYFDDMDNHSVITEEELVNILVTKVKNLVYEFIGEAKTKE